MNGAQCEEEETLKHFFVDCPESRQVFSEVKEKILRYTNNENSFPPVSDISFIMCGYSSTKGKMRTAVWATYVFLSKFYDIKLVGKRLPDFLEVWNWAKEDLRIAKLS